MKLESAFPNSKPATLKQELTLAALAGLDKNTLSSIMGLSLGQRKDLVRPANSAHVRQSRPDPGLRFQVKALQIVCVVPSLLRWPGWTRTRFRRLWASRWGSAKTWSELLSLAHTHTRFLSLSLSPSLSHTHSLSLSLSLSLSHTHTLSLSLSLSLSLTHTHTHTLTHSLSLLRGRAAGSASSQLQTC